MLSHGEAHGQLDMPVCSEQCVHRMCKAVAPHGSSCRNSYTACSHVWVTL